MFNTVIIILKNELYRTEIALEETPLINERLQQGYKKTISELQSAIEVLQKAASIKRDCKYYQECSLLNTILPGCDIGECAEYDKAGEGK